MSIILTINAGSTNTKIAAYDCNSWECKGHTITHSTEQTDEWLCSISALDIIGISHRVVHGGRVFSHPEIITDAVVTKIEALIPLAPLHQPASIRLIEAARKLYPELPHIACFDTTFHHTITELERRLPLPADYDKAGIQRYGFHGLSYEHIASVLPDYAGDAAEGRVVVAHLGGGSSACAMKNRQSVASTMGFSALDGMMMSTRCGSLDAGVILYLLEQKHMKPEEISHLLYHESGLKGVSGISADMRDLLASEQPDAKEAIALYCHLAAKQIASLLPALDGLDVLVFTGGIGENNAGIREAITNRLRWVGGFDVYAIPTNEELVMAQSCSAKLKEISHAA